MGATFVDGLDGAGGENKSDGFLEFRHVNALFLKIGVLANRPCRVKLGSTSPVGVASTHLGTLLVYGANSRHVRSNLHDIMPECKLTLSSRSPFSSCRW